MCQCYPWFHGENVEGRLPLICLNESCCNFILQERQCVWHTCWVNISLYVVCGYGDVTLCQSHLHMSHKQNLFSGFYMDTWRIFKLLCRVSFRTPSALRVMVIFFLSNLRYWKGDVSSLKTSNYIKVIPKDMGRTEMDESRNKMTQRLSSGARLCHPIAVVQGPPACLGAT